MPKKIDLSGSNNPNLTISIAQLQSIADRYKTERYDHLVPAYIPSDSRAVWLGKDAIDEFFACNEGCTGLRFYFGVIDDFNHRNGAHNLIIAATDNDDSNNFNNDRLGESDCVIVTETFNAPLKEGARSAHCPPPNDPCGGNKIRY